MLLINGKGSDNRIGQRVKHETRNIGADIAPVQFRAANQRDDPAIFMSRDRACKG